MRQTHWTRIAERMRAALMMTYPTIAWRTELFAAPGDAHPTACAGIAVHARRGAAEHAIRVPATAIEHTPLRELVHGIYAEVAQRLGPIP